MVDLDELDRKRAVLPPTIMGYAPHLLPPDEPIVVMYTQSAADILNAYPELSAELKGTRKMEAEALLALAKVADLISENGCDCECGHHYEEHDDDCERCLACRVEECFSRPIRDALAKVQR